MTGKGHSTAPSTNTAGLLPLVLFYTSISSLGGGMVANGVFFVTKESLQFTDTMNLWLAFVQYLPYIPAALFAGRVTDRVGPRNTLLLSVAGMSVCAAMMGSGYKLDILIWIIAPLYSIAAGLHWPIVESYVTSGRHGASMRRAIGAFNMTWSGTICGTLWVVAALTDRIDHYFLVLLLLHVISLPILFKWPSHPLPHDAGEAERHTGRTYHALLISSRWMLPLSYMLMYVISPLLPGIWAQLDVSASVGAMWSSSWMFARVLAFAVMAFTAGWHGRFSVPWIGTLLLVGGTALALLVPYTFDAESVNAESHRVVAVGCVIAGLIAFGIGQGIVYYVALYYGMTVERAAVGSGGRHEAIIGLGYCAGPGIALVGEFALGGTVGMQIAVGVLTACGLVAAVRPCLPHRNGSRAGPDEADDEGD